MGHYVTLSVYEGNLIPATSKNMHACAHTYFTNCLLKNCVELLMIHLSERNLTYAFFPVPLFHS